MWVTRVSINNPVFATMVMVGIVVLGLFSYARLRVEQMPDVSLPFVDIETAYPGASPEVVESDVSKPIEYAVNTVSGVKRIYSNSREGRSQVFVEFRLGTEVTRAIQDARDKIALVRPNFPRDVKDPQVIRVEIEDNRPTISLAVLSPTVELRELTSLTDQTIVKAIENIPGVAQVIVNGRVTRQILIQIKPSALTSLGIGVDQVMTAVQNANQDVPAGRITRGHNDSIVRVEGKIKDPAQFSRIIVAQQGGGPVYLSQVADVIDGEKELDSISRINGRPSITIDIRKAQDANIIETGRGVREAIESLKARLPQDVEVRLVYSQADQVEASVAQVKATIVEGALLTVLIVFLFLHSWRSTIITGLTLPIAVIATFIALYAFGFTLNMMTLRRDRRAREHRAPPGEGQDASCGGARRHRRDRARGHGHHLRHCRGVRADRVHEGHRRPVLLPVRLDSSGRRAGVSVRQFHARSDALLGLARSRGLALFARALARPLHGSRRT
ncbi:MAG: efflux RND transporter permease subunit [Betaproteobacteria bacterium]|nr:MAG: efflux RND transporter permease subunit [Betaproteobacteria bacterium]